MRLKFNRSGRKPLHAIERKQRLAASAQDRSTELSQQRKRMRLLRDRETPARRLQIHFNITTHTFQLHALSRKAFCTMCIPSYYNKLTRSLGDMASMVNGLLAIHFTIDVTWQSSPLIKYKENSVPRVLVYSFCMACIPHRPLTPVYTLAGLTSRHLLEFK